MSREKYDLLEGLLESSSESVVFPLDRRCLCFREPRGSSSRAFALRLTEPVCLVVRGGRACGASVIITSRATAGAALATCCGVGGASELEVTENVAEEGSVEAPSMVKNNRPSLFGADIVVRYVLVALWQPCKG